MEANREAALKYIELAEKAIRTNDRQRALKFLNKSESLYPTAKAKELLERISSSDFSSKRKSSENLSENDEEEKAKTTNSSTRHRANSNNTTTTNDFTTEEAEAVRKIKNCKDFYEILDVSKTATEADLKKAYRKLALQYHPDKCKAPGATEAFKAIGKAFSVLNDPKKREQYDQYGHAMEPQYQRGNGGAARGHGTQYYYYGDDDDEFSAEELFNMFFGYTGPVSRHHRRRHHGQTFHFTTQQQTQTSAHTLVQLLPYLFLFLISILGTFFVSEPQFQLHRTGKYSHPRTTRSLGVEYFVKPDFRPAKNPSDFDKFESTVIDEYISDLRHQCYREQQYKESLLWRARMMNDNELYRQAQRTATPTCTTLNDFVQRIRA